MTIARIKKQARPLSSRDHEAAKSKRLQTLASPSKDVIISADALCFLRTRTEQRAFLPLFQQAKPDIHIVLVTRALADWQASWENQLRKDIVYNQIKSLPDHQRINGDWYYDLDAIRRFWQPFGQRHEVCDDDHHDICTAMLDKLKLPKDGLTFPKRMNKPAP